MSPSGARAEVAVRPVGRPRSEKCRVAIATAVAALLEERSYAAVTVEAVAARAGVSKQTIYRWWSGKHALAMDSYAEWIGRRVPEPHRASLRADLRQLVRRTCAVLRERRSGETVAGLIAASQSDPALAEDFRTRFIGTRRRVMQNVLERGQARGELRQDVDLPLAIDLLFGPIWYRLLLRNAPLDRRFADALVEQFLRAVGASRG